MKLNIHLTDIIHTLHNPPSQQSIKYLKLLNDISDHFTTIECRSLYLEHPIYRYYHQRSHHQYTSSRTGQRQSAIARYRSDRGRVERGKSVR